MKRFDAGETTDMTQETQQTTGQPHVGRPMQCAEDTTILTGHGHYVDDLGVKPSTPHTAILRLPHARAEFGLIDFAVASKVPGVRAVLTRADLSAWSKSFVMGVKMPME